MVQFIPAKDDWANAFRQIGSGVTQGYMNRSDENALQKSIGDLGPNPSARQILDAVTNTKTYGKEAKQKLFENYLGIEKLEQAKAQASEKRKLAELKQMQNQQEADLIIENSPNLSQDEKKAYVGNLSAASARSLASKVPEVTEYNVAENQAKRFQPQVENYIKKAIESEQAVPLLETGIVNNEAYTDAKKSWDTFLDVMPGTWFQQFKSKTGQQLEAITPLSISSFGSKMSGVLTNAKMAQIAKKAVNLGKDKETNRLFMYLDYYDRKLDQLKARISNEIIRENKYGLPPSDFDEKLRHELKPYQKMMSRDIDRMLNDQLPSEPISKLDLTKQFDDLLEPGEIAMVDANGNFVAIPEEDMDLPENKDLKRIML